MPQEIFYGFTVGERVPQEFFGASIGDGSAPQKMLAVPSSMVPRRRLFCGFMSNVLCLKKLWHNAGGMLSCQKD
jgi:hypothetical protein